MSVNILATPLSVKYLFLFVSLVVYAHLSEVLQERDKSTLIIDEHAVRVKNK